MTVTQVLERLAMTGGELRIQGDSLVLKRPPSGQPLPPELVEGIKANREELLAVISDAALAKCVLCGKEAYTYGPEGRPYCERHTGMVWRCPSCGRKELPAWSPEAAEWLCRACAQCQLGEITKEEVISCRS